MGLSCIFLVEKGSNIDMESVIISIDNICKESEGKFYFAHEKDGADASFCNIGNKPFDGSDESCDNQICLYIFEEFSEPDPYKIYLTFEFEEPQKSYYRLIITEDFDEREDVLFKFAYEILKKYPDMKIYIYDYLYSLKDLEKINNKPFDENWCYTDPKLLL
jgi:hypothetical protein